MKRIFEHKKEEVTRGWRKLHNGLLHDFYYFLELSGW